MKTWEPTGLPCPQCSGKVSRIVDSRMVDNIARREVRPARRRRHECSQCGERFTTYETIYSEPPTEMEQLIEASISQSSRIGADSTEVFSELVGIAA